MALNNNDNNDSLASDLNTLLTIFSTKSPLPPLGWPDLLAFESKHNITLPEPFRTFTATIANGCPNGPPYYGLIPLGHKGTSNNPIPDHELNLASSFPLTKPWLWEENSDPPEGYPGEEPDSQILLRGCLELGTDGCGMDWCLIVTGEQRRQIWQIVDTGAVPFGEMFSCPGEGGFVEWVKCWAEGKGWFGEMMEEG
jgi:hypothetical protein